MAALFAIYALLVLGLILCFFGRFPGQVLAYAGLLIASFATNTHPYPVWLLVVCGVLVVASLIVNKKVAPKVASKVHEFGKAGKLGTVIGSIISIFFIAATSNEFIAIVFFLVFPYLFSFIFEFAADKNLVESAKRAAGAYTLFATSTLMNLAICVFCLGEVVYGWM